MACGRTWLRVLVALLILPILAVGGGVSVCTCHHEVVYAGSSCGCGHGHMHRGDEQKPQPEEHQCAHVDNEMLATSADVLVPVFDLEAAMPAEVPDFHWCMSRMHSLVALTLERTGLWDPPETRTLPLLI